MSWERTQCEHWYLDAVRNEPADLIHVSSTDSTYANKGTKLLWKVWVARSKLDWRTPDVDDA